MLLKSIKRAMAYPVPLPALAKPETYSLVRLEQTVREVGGTGRAEIEYHTEKCLLPGLGIEKASS